VNEEYISVEVRNIGLPLSCFNNYHKVQSCRLLCQSIATIPTNEDIYAM
jgi:hypothetical protein